MKTFIKTFAITALLLTGIAVKTAKADDVVVFAAASLKNALDDISAEWNKKTGKKAKFSFASSSSLAKQIDNGAPADIYFSANISWVDFLEKNGRIDEKTRFNVLGNRIVLIAPADSDAKAEIKKGFDMASMLGDSRLAVSETKGSPAGRYSKMALENLGIWDSVKDKLAEGSNVRAALRLVSIKEAPLGIVYKTDAVSDKKVKVIAAFPESSHKPIIYPVTKTKDSTNPDADAFLAFLKTPTAKKLFEKQGFKVIVQK